ncbi:MAG: hypothetical protein WBO45_05460, partial [Planctomycetota bacterium]
AQAPAVATPPPAAGEVLAPLRTVLDGLVSNQAELAARQLALTQELQRWSQLLVESVTGARADEAKAMAQKLSQLEETLKQQDARHREVETLLQGALERTADRLDDFLRRLHGIDKPANATPGAGPPGGGAGGTGTEPNKQPNGNDGKRPLGARASTTRWWWLGLTGLSCLVAAFFLRRAFRAPPVSGPPRAAAPREQTAEELWAAAALLGEAVDRLRQNQGAGRDTNSPVPTGGLVSPAANQETEADLDEFVVIADDDPIEGPAVRPRLAPAGTAPPTSPPPGPERLHCALPGHAAPAAALAFLAAEPRVLRRPGPTVTPGPGGPTIEFAVLPGLSPGERAHLLLGVRAAATRRQG